MKVKVRDGEVEYGMGFGKPALQQHEDFWRDVFRLLRKSSGVKVINGLAKDLAQVTYNNPEVCEWMAGRRDMPRAQYGTGMMTSKDWDAPSVGDGGVVAQDVAPADPTRPPRVPKVVDDDTGKAA